MKRVWTEEKDNLLRRHYPKRDLDWLAQRLGVTREALKARARILGLRRKVHRREPWTDKHLDYLRTHYADTRAEDIARKVHHSVQSVWRTAARLGLKKSPEFLAQWGRLVSYHRQKAQRPDSLSRGTSQPTRASASRSL